MTFMDTKRDETGQEQKFWREQNAKKVKRMFFPDSGHRYRNSRLDTSLPTFGGKGTLK